MGQPRPAVRVELHQRQRGRPEPTGLLARRRRAVEHRRRTRTDAQGRSRHRRIPGQKGRRVRADRRRGQEGVSTVKRVSDLPGTRGSTRTWAVVAVAVAAQTLLWLDNSILNIALETLADPVRGLGANAGELAWASSSYSLVLASAMFAGGALGDRYGPRATLFAGLVVFSTASAFAAFSASAFELVLTRGLMGLGSALLMPATLSIIVRTTSEAQRSRAIALWASASGLGVALGPVLGGVLLARFWWGSVFLINVPVVLACLAGVVAFVPRLRFADRRPLDPFGLVLSVLGLGSLVYGIIEGGQRADWL